MSESDGELPPADAPPPAEPAPAEPAPAELPRPDTAALYLARCLVADQGYMPGSFAEAAPLAEASDIILTSGDGVGLVIACIVDRDLDPDRRFRLPPADVDDAAAACRHHAGSVHGIREGVSVEIWEVGAGVPDAEDRRRLEAYTFRQITQKGVQVKTYAVNTAPGAEGEMFSTAADGLRRESWIRQVMKEPRRSPEVLRAKSQQRDKVARFHTRPVATVGLLAAFAAVYVLSLVWTVMPADSVGSPGIGTLVSLGALDHGRVEEHGEWWRMLTCAFLHGGPLHLIFNGVAMYMAGGVLENLVGRAWTLALFVVGAIGGSIASFVFNPAHVTSVGASGAIMAMLAAGMVVCLRLPKGPARTQIMISLGYILLPSLLPLATHSGQAPVDIAAHIGGAITGAIAGGLVLLIWRREDERPRGKQVAAAVAVAGLLYTAFGLIQTARAHDEHVKDFAAAAAVRRDPSLTKQLAPDETFLGTDEQITARIESALATYPRDPRVQQVAGLIAMQNQDLKAAIAHFDRALAERELMGLFNPTFEMMVRYHLSRTHELDDNAPLAHAVLTPSCDLGKATDDEDIRSYYQTMCIAP